MSEKKFPFVILIQPKSDTKQSIYAPLGILHLAAYLKTEYEVAIIDIRVQKDYKKVLSKLLERKPLAIGITALTGSQILHALDVSRYIKRISSRTPVIWGGIHATFLPKQTLDNPFVDIVIKNEGEISLYEALSAIQDGSDLTKIRGIAYKNNGSIIENMDREFLDMNRLPMPAWELLDLEPYIWNISQSKTDRPMNITTSRGCPYQCTFCYNLKFNKGRWRYKDISLVIQEIKYLVEKHKINRIIIHDDNFVADKMRALDFAKKIKEEGLKIKWSITLRIDDFEEEFLRVLTNVGLYHLRVGGESGSQRILDRIQKGISVDKIIDSAHLAKKLGLTTVYTFVIGWPGETDEDVKKTVKLAFKLLEINPLTYIQPLYIYTPYPGTELFEEAKKMGFRPPMRLEDWGRFQWSRSNMPWIKDRKIFESMHTLSKFAFYNRKVENLWQGCVKKDRVYPKVFLRRLCGLFVRGWARFRLKRDFCRFPYEYRFFMKVLEKF